MASVPAKRENKRECEREEKVLVHERREKGPVHKRKVSVHARREKDMCERGEKASVHARREKKHMCEREEKGPVHERKVSARDKREKRPACVKKVSVHERGAMIAPIFVSSLREMKIVSSV